MGAWRDFPLPDGSYSDSTRPWSQQDVVNYLPTYAEAPGTRSRVKFTPVPGLEAFATVGTGPHRGARDVEGRGFVVSGTKLYQVSPGGTSTEIGTIPGTGLVSMTHNQIAGGNQLVIGTRDNSYVYDTVSGTLTATGVGLLSVDFLGQYILGVDTQRRFWRHSLLADATTYSDLDVYSAESAPDRIIGGVASQSEWLVFGERTIEPWVNAPVDTKAFQKQSGTVVEKGCANANTIRRLDNSVFWLGNDLIVYRLQGYSAVPISTKAQAEAFGRCDPAKALAFTYEDNGYVIYYLTFQDGMTWGYDVTSQRWHRRESFGLDRWRLNTLWKWNGRWYGGDYSSGAMYRLAWGDVHEGGTILSRRIRTGVLHSDGNRVFIHGLRMLVETGASVPYPVPVLIGEMGVRTAVERAGGYEVSLDTTVYGGVVACEMLTPVSAEFVSGTVYTDNGEVSPGVASSHCVDYDIPAGTPNPSTATVADLVVTFPYPPAGQFVLIDSYFNITVDEGGTYLTRVQARQV